jgi:hypothetical protein
MGYGKSKPGMFKMKHQGVPALLKALTGGQKEMVGKMRKQGKTSAADKIEKGILAEPAKKAAVKLDPTDAEKRAKSSAKLKRDAEGRVVGTSTETGGDIPLGTKKGTRKIAARTGKSFDEEGNVKLGKNKKFEDNLLTLPDGTIIGYRNTKGERVNFESKDRVNKRKLKSGSKVGGRLTGRGLSNRALENAASDYYKYNTAIDNVNRASDKASKVVSAEKEGDNVRYNERKKSVKTAAAQKAKSPVKKMGVGSKSIRQRIKDDAQKKKSAPATKKMYKK